ncbi:MAG: sugar transferase, partial [Terriglobales bacterium]
MQAARLREQLKIPQHSPVIGFVGRFTGDKGIAELTAAYWKLRSQYSDLYLLLVGDFEDGNPIDVSLRERILTDDKIIQSGFVSTTAPYYLLMDVLILPTYREGFPNVCLEAQAAGIPVITTDSTGAKESVIHGQTGFVVPVRDSEAIVATVEHLLNDPDLRARMGTAGREWVSREFKPENVWNALLLEYEQALADHKSGRKLRKSTSRFVKSIFDRVLAAAALLILSPIFAACSMAVLAAMGYPILFRQRRPGIHGKPFTLLKFRTMSDARGPDGKLLPDERRLTRVGAFLRSVSLDEFPQLWNVLRGDMSLVGPRPLLMQYLPRYTPEQARRHEVLPGITGWTQVNGRNGLSWEEKFRLDLWYVENWCLILDLKILLRTALCVLRRDGVSRQGFATMPEFMGSQNLAAQDRS